MDYLISEIETAVSSRKYPVFYLDTFFWTTLYFVFKYFLESTLPKFELMVSLQEKSKFR